MIRAHLTARISFAIIAAVIALYSLFPFLWFFLVSLTSPGNIPTGLELPSVITVQSYVAVLTGAAGPGGIGAKFSIVPNIMNSFIIGAITVALCMAISFGAAYVFSRVRNRSLDAAFNFFLLVRVTPGVALAVPIYLLINAYHLRDTYLGISLAHTLLSLPLAIWLLKGFIDEIPVELDEAAYVDGAGLLTVLAKVVLPLAAPGVAVTSFFIFMASYTEFMFASTLSNGSVNTLPMAIAAYDQPTQTFYNEMSAASFISMVPMALIFSFAGRYIVGGLIRGAVKA